MRPENPSLAAQQLGAVFSDLVIGWQVGHGRSELPWQGTQDPYRVWLSEVMLQQTQVATVLGYFARFLERFPTVQALAVGSEDEVFGLWSGLGYYSRARNMHRCSKDVVSKFGGKFPRTAAELQTLPGIGRSTAAAIAAFCYGERVAILDGNVKRVLARVLGFKGDLSSAAQERALWAAAAELLPSQSKRREIARYTQGLMDMGAIVCVPRKPTCLTCPVNDHCAARAEGAPESYPVKTRKLRRGAESIWMLRARDAQGRVWLEKRPSRGIWAGLYCLPIFGDRDSLLDVILPAHRLSVHEDASFVHILTHKDLHIHPISVDWDGASALTDSGRWLQAGEWRGLGLPAPVRKLLLADS